LRDPLLGILSFPFLFSAAFSLLSPFSPFYISISAQYHHTSSKRMLGAESVERSEQGWKAERVK
jgi:hypothetical protein